MSARSIVIAGAGLIGTSIGLALRLRGHDVHITDIDAQRVDAACSRGAGHPYDGEHVDVAVIATPPDAVADAATRFLAGDVHAVTDTASVRRVVVDQLTDPRFVGGHPLAGGADTGPSAARADLFERRRWVLTPAVTTAAASLELARWLVEECAATPVIVDAAHHDHVLARTSHLPQLIASLLAVTLLDLEHRDLVMSGPTLREMTRDASSDPELWAQIIMGNADEVVDALHAVVERVAELAGAVRDGTDSVRDLIREGGAGRAHLDDALREAMPQ